MFKPTIFVLTKTFHSEEFMTIQKLTLHEKLSAIQKELKAPKSRFNKFGGFAYRNCEDILDAVKKHLDGLIVTISDEMVLVGTRHYVKATAVLSDGTHTVFVSAYAREPELKKGMDEAQITGATSSYARKYALNGLFCIDDSKDADSDHPPFDEKKVEQHFQAAAAPAQNKSASKANNLTDDQVRQFEITFGKYKGYTLHQISAQTTESGAAKGIEWMEWFIEQDATTDQGKTAQEVVRRFLNEVVSRS